MRKQRRERTRPEEAFAEFLTRRGYRVERNVSDLPASTWRRDIRPRVFLARVSPTRNHSAEQPGMVVGEDRQQSPAGPTEG